MSMDYVRNAYGIPVQRGQLVRVIGSDTVMRVTSCSYYVHVVRDDYPNRRQRWHPLDLEYEVLGEWKQYSTLSDPLDGQ